jgi:hypothetical protein
MSEGDQYASRVVSAGVVPISLLKSLGGEVTNAHR